MSTFFDFLLRLDGGGSPASWLMLRLRFTISLGSVDTTSRDYRDNNYSMGVLALGQLMYYSQSSK